MKEVFGSDVRAKLQYRASRDGFAGQHFHTKCDGIANTLTIIKSTNGNIFGGFVEKAWNSTSIAVLDPKAFIFSLVNKENLPFKAMCKKGAYSILCYPTHGPSFGGLTGCDIHIASNSNENTNSYSYYGCSYMHPDCLFHTDEAYSILNGSYSFQTIEIEVFSVTN